MERLKRFLYHRLIVLFFLTISGALYLYGQTGTEFGTAPLGEKWTLTTRWDYRVRIDGRYLGFANRELREVYRRGDRLPGGWSISGEATLLGATKKNGAPVAARLDGAEQVSFTLADDGSIMQSGEGYPRLRGFPTFPAGILEPGDIWEAPIGIIITGPEGQKGLLNQTASYRYIDNKPYRGRPAANFEVLWAVRNRNASPEVYGFLNSLEGSHKVSLVVDLETGAPIMATDSLKERWVYTDSRVEQREGFALMFWDGIPPLDRGGVKRHFEERFPDVIYRGGLVYDDTDGDGDSGGSFGSSDSQNSSSDYQGTRAERENLIVDLEDSDLEDSDIVITETERGLSVTLRNLHFKPDLPDLLPEDRPILDELAAILTSIPGRTVLVRGHTADVGRPNDEKTLSEERAKKIADELSGRGVDPRRLIYEGVGSVEPLASNETEAGKRRNRRVELLILED